jgi:hypothetical protein
MEALLEKEADVESWNDERMDELSTRVDDGFKETRELFAEIDRKLDRIPTREELDHRFASTDKKIDQGFESTERRVDRVSTRFEHMIWATIAVAGGFFGNLFADKL